MGNDLTLKASALELGFVTETEFDRLADPAKMVHPYVADDPTLGSPENAELHQ